MRYAVLDVETANPRFSSICQLGVAIFENRQYLDGISILVDPEDDFHPVNVGIHGIKPEDIAGAPRFTDAWRTAEAFAADRILVHHTSFDRSSVRAASAKYALNLADRQWLDSAVVVRRVWAEFSERGYGLGNLTQHFDIQFQHHDALEDARAAGLILAKALDYSGTSVADWPALIAQRSSRPTITYAGSSYGQLAGEQIVFTGTLSKPRSLWSAEVAAAGAAVANSVSKKTSIVVVGEQDLSRFAGKDKSEKHARAEQLALSGHPIRIICEADLQTMLEQA